MNATDWNAIADAYSEIDDPEERPVLTFIRRKLSKLQPKRLLDYGGGDGKFALMCAESLSPQEIVTYDPAPRMTSLARSLCADFKQIRVTESTEEIKSGTFDVVTFNAVWMCLTSREACLDTLKKIARLLARMVAWSHRSRIHVFGRASFRAIQRTSITAIILMKGHYSM